jgi:hypothetical protein
VCIIGNKEAAGIIVDTYGFTDWKLQAPKRILDTRELKQTLQPGQERIIETGIPNALFIGKLAIDNASGAGWFSAYPAATGYQGDSLVNPDGKSATSGLMIIATDAAGRVAIQGNVAGDLIIDQAGIIPLKDLGIDPAALTPPKRLLDTRQAQVLEGTQIISGTGDFVTPEMLDPECAVYLFPQGNPELNLPPVPVQWVRINANGLTSDPTPNDKSDYNGDTVNGFFIPQGTIGDSSVSGYVRSDGRFIANNSDAAVGSAGPNRLRGLLTLNRYSRTGTVSIARGVSVIWLDIACESKPYPPIMGN